MKGLEKCALFNELPSHHWDQDPLNNHRLSESGEMDEDINETRLAKS